MGQWKKDGSIIDERWNGGGQIPDRFIELLNRPMLAYWAVRDGASWQWPPVAHRGPQVMLINGWSGSGGDAFPTYFKQAGIGPVIGTRTWGGLIGISGAPQLVDGGNVSRSDVPDVRPKGLVREGHGVEPDIEVIDDPSQLAKGMDPQLARAIKEVQDRIAKPQAPDSPRAREAHPEEGGERASSGGKAGAATVGSERLSSLLRARTSSRFTASATLPLTTRGGTSLATSLTGVGGVARRVLGPLEHVVARLPHPLVLALGLGQRRAHRGPHQHRRGSDEQRVLAQHPLQVVLRPPGCHARFARHRAPTRPVPRWSIRVRPPPL